VARSLIRMSPDSLIIRLPVLLGLDASCDVAARPVHVKNIGLLDGEPLDHYWRQVYQVTGAGGTRGTVESFVEQQPLRPYYNSHALAVKPEAGLFRRRLQCFERLVGDR